MALDYTIRIGRTPTFLYFDLYLYTGRLPAQHSAFNGIITFLTADPGKLEYIYALLNSPAAHLPCASAFLNFAPRWVFDKCCCFSVEAIEFTY